MQSIRVQFPTDEIIFISLLLEIEKKTSKCTIAHLKKNYYQVLTCRLMIFGFVSLGECTDSFRGGDS